MSKPTQLGLSGRRETADERTFCQHCHEGVADYERIIETEAGCCGQFLRTGECCGNPFPVPVERWLPITCPHCEGHYVLEEA